MQMCFPVRYPSWVFQLLQNLSNLHHVKQVHAQIFKVNLHQHPHTAPKLIAAFSRCRQLALAFNIFNRVPHPNVFLYNTLIRAHVYNAQSSQALALFVDMKANGVYPDHCTFPFLLKACSGNSWLRVVKMIHAQVEKFGFSDDISVSDSLFHSYNNCGVIAFMEVPMLIKRTTESAIKLIRERRRSRPVRTFENPVQLDLNHAYVEANLPDGLLSKTGLAWMLQQESSNFQGGFLADDQGLGKTISMIALIQMQRSLQSKFKSKHLYKNETKSLELHDDEDRVCCSLDKINKTEESNLISTTAAGTLIVCPLSILQQWAREFDEKVPEEAKLSVLVYHGGSRTRNPEELAGYDVVLTTYYIVSNEVPVLLLVDPYENIVENKRKRVSKRGKNGRKGLDSSSFDYGFGSLARVGWFRVILDEAHIIKNLKTKVARACCGLQAEKRWCLSCTPLQNATEDLYSYFRFLKISKFRYSILDYKTLHLLLRDTMLRRTKETMIHGKPIVNLPPKTIYLTKLEFSSQERAIYDELEARLCSRFEAYDTAGEVDKNYITILEMLLLLRRACDHPLLLNEYYSDYVANDSVAMASTLPTEKAINLLEVLENSEAICRVCNDLPENPVVTMCGQVFCYQCVSENMMCPATECNKQVGPDVVFSKSTLKSCLFKDLEVHNEYPSSKVRAVIEIIQSLCKLNSPNDGPIKIIIFSQWTKMLDLVGNALDEHCIQYRRLDGTMTVTSRDTAVKEFNTDPQVTIMLMSLKAGNLGLNMIAACHVILLDPWWNPTTEDQAVDRAHRIGQTRPLTVIRLIIKDTIEERVLELQEEKRKMIASAFNEDYRVGSAVVLSHEDLRYLFLGTKPRDSA